MPRIDAYESELRIRQRRMILAMLSFIETPLFTRLVYVCLSGEEYAALQAHLARDSESGDVVPGSGGVRKLRRGVAGRGKRGGVRVIYSPEPPKASFGC